MTPMLEDNPMPATVSPWQKLAKLLRLASRSLAGKFVALAAIFLILPLTLYAKFEAADAGRQAFLLRTLQVQGRLAAQVLEPVLTRVGGRSLLDAAKAVETLANDQIRIKLLLRPAGRGDTFFLVAASPPIDQSNLDKERVQLGNTGILPNLDESCGSNHPLAVRYSGTSGEEELLTSISPLYTEAGCWAIITSYATADLVSSSLAKPFSDTPEVQLAMAFYGLMAVLMAMAVTGMLFDLRAFAKLAHRIRQGGAAGEQSFAAVAAIPELLPVAREFDHMVATLDASARSLRETAEDNAHAFKAPIAAITQSLEPLRHCSAGEPRASQALQTIERALERLGQLVNASRRLDEGAAELMKAKLQVIDLAALAANMAHAYHRLHSAQGLKVIARTGGPASVVATEESLETIIENLLDNAVSFSPPQGSVRVNVANSGRKVRLSVEDDGPGVPTDQLELIFRRNFSDRPRSDNSEPHFGIGLAVVRRNVELLGGQAHAENVMGAGLRVVITLPAA
jgi:two-component system sensor histidine kinase ChvG